MAPNVPMGEAILLVSPDDKSAEPLMSTSEAVRQLRQRGHVIDWPKQVLRHLKMPGGTKQLRYFQPDGHRPCITLATPTMAFGRTTRRHRRPNCVDRDVLRAGPAWHIPRRLQGREGATWAPSNPQV